MAAALLHEQSSTSSPDFVSPSALQKLLPMHYDQAAGNYLLCGSFSYKAWIAVCLSPLCVCLGTDLHTAQAEVVCPVDADIQALQKHMMVFSAVP